MSYPMVLIPALPPKERSLSTVFSTGTLPGSRRTRQSDIFLASLSASSLPVKPIQESPSMDWAKK